MAGSDGERDGLQEGIEASEGDPRVLAVMNAILSTAFAGMLLWGLDLIGALDFSLLGLAIVAAGLFVLTHTVTQ